jgi:Protein of unknown function DUF262
MNIMSNAIYSYQNKKMTVWSMFEFVKYSLKEKNIIKPRIQRQKRWTDEDNKQFIDFLIKRKKNVMPFLLNEKIINSRRIYYLFDGNNRANAILDFILKPLSILNDYIPSTFHTMIKKHLSEIPLETLMKPRYNLQKLYRDLPDEYKELKEEKIKEEDEIAFEDMLEKIGNWKFFDIQLSMSIEYNLSDEEMCDLYTSINKSGKILTKQELLAGSTFHIKFVKENLPIYFNPFIEHLQVYYGKMSDNEQLMIEESGSTNITLFEVLVAFQMHLSSKYRINDKKSFLHSYTGEANKDVVFSLYEHLGGKYEAVDYNQVYSILQDIEYGFDIIVNTYKNLYDSDINAPSFRDKSFYPSLHKNVAILLCLYVILNKGTEIRSELKRLCTFHDLMSLHKKNNKDKEYGYDPIEYHGGGAWMPQQIKKLIEKKTFDSIPSVDNVIELCQDILLYDSTCIKTGRKSLTLVKALAVSAFYNYQIPSHRKLEPHDMDHIIPFSTKEKSSVDICRLGNLQLISSSINRSRGTKPISDQWIVEHDLTYQHYPSQSEYEKICTSNKLLSPELYNDMCLKREELYVKQLRRLLS